MDEARGAEAVAKKAGTAQGILQELSDRFGQGAILPQSTKDGIPTAWVSPELLPGVLKHLKSSPEGAYPMLWDITAIDERTRVHREGQPASDFTVVYHLLSLERNQDVRIKVALHGDQPSVGTVSSIYSNADWYEREVWDMFGIKFDGHPHLFRILMPPWWEGHPLRKEHPARATEMGPFQMSSEDAHRMLSMMEFRPEDWGLKREDHDHEFMFLNFGPQHPSTHGVLRFVAQLDGEEIVDVVPEIGFHHRGAEKMGERQSWHTYIPYTDRIDYLGGVLNNFPYVLAVETLAGITVPGPGKGHPHHDGGDLPHHQPPRLFRHVHRGHRPDVHGLLDVHRPGAGVRHRGSRHGRPHAPGMVSHRRGCAGPARSAGTRWCGTSPRTCTKGSGTTTPPS